jgi:CheY-specific phosphatase CheX
MANIRKIEETLMRSIFEVFERMFFIFAEPSRDPMRSCRMKASIGFEGPFTGEMQIRIENELLKKMARNMLNLEEKDLTGPVMEDCLKEAVNMICGSFLRKVEPDHQFKLSIPIFEMISAEPVSEKQGQSEIRLDFAAEDSGFEVRFQSPDVIKMD